METSLYEDGSAARRNEPDLKKLKSSMFLDLASNTSKQLKLNGLLGSPDLNLLKLASPELERMIISQNGLVTTTPTPTQFLFPRSVTEEQDDFAKGFVDALAQLHSKTHFGPGGAIENESDITMTLEASVQEAGLPYHPTSVADSNSRLGVRPIEIAPVNHPTSTHNTQTLVSSGFTDISAPNQRLMQLKEEPQTVPCISNSPSSIGSISHIQPINMETQETIKVERKRARNRVAARKCRTRKLERIGRLEERVDDLKGQNSDLSQTASQLREQVCALKKQIMTHVNSGCHVMLSPNLL